MKPNRRTHPAVEVTASGVISSNPAIPEVINRRFTTSARVSPASLSVRPVS
jgi:hypothetical protein